MTTKQENVITMWNTTNSVLTTNNAVWTGLTAFNAAVVRFRSKLSTSAIYVATQQSKTQGVTTDKKTSRDLAIAQGVIISADIQAFAKVTNNNTLFMDMNFPKSTLEKLPDTTLVTTLQLIHTTATANLAALAGYGVVAATLTAYQTLIGNYNTYLAAPAARKATKKTATSNLASIIKDGNSELDTLDKLVGNFSVSNPDFVSTFKNARVIIDSGVTHTKLKGVVKDAITGDPIPDAIIRQAIIGQIAITDADGNYSTLLDFGIFDFNCTAPGYQQLDKLHVTILKGHSNHLDFNLIH
jgi:hypothetical protein